MSKQKQIAMLLLLASIVLAAISCTVSSNKEPFFGKTVPPERNIFRYVTGDEPESLDPAISNGQPEARIYMALYDGLVEYDGKTLEPRPALAERWEGNNDSSEFKFYLRHNGRWSNGDPIDANDFVYTFRRALAKETASRNAYLAYYIKYAQAYNEQKVFVRDPQTGQFLNAKDFDDATPPEPIAGSPLDGAQAEYVTAENEPQTPESDFHKALHTPLRLTLPGDAKARTKALDADPKLKAAVAGKELVPVKAEDIGVEAIDQYTVRVSLVQPAPFFVGLLAHQVFRIVPRKVIEKYGNLDAAAEHRHLWSIQSKNLAAVRQAGRRTRSDVLGRRHSQTRRDPFLSDGGQSDDHESLQSRRGRRGAQPHRAECLAGSRENQEGLHGRSGSGDRLSADQRDASRR